jgi:UDP-N-acetylmuramoylalanine-D-glutamate ligase
LADAPLICATLQGRQVDGRGSMAQAVSLAAAQAYAGDAVLMTSACASLITA